MAGSPKQKIKLLYLMKILLERTDEQHPISAAGLIFELGRYGVEAERKSIYSDVECLRVFGLDVIFRRERPSGYFIGKRDFELAELKLLVDAAQTFHSISQKKTRDLIRKISTLTSVHEAKQLNRTVLISNLSKTVNERVYYNIDAIHEAINAKRKISFLYFDYTLDMEKNYRRGGQPYIQTPMALSWDSNNYYLITYNPRYEDLSSFRVDRMENILMTDEGADRIAEERFNLSQYLRENFGMYNAPNVSATVCFDIKLLGVVREKFGYDLPIIKLNDYWFQITAEVSDSPTFLGWIFQFGGRAVIKAPQSLINRMHDMLKSQLQEYNYTDLQ